MRDELPVDLFMDLLRVIHLGFLERFRHLLEHGDDDRENPAIREILELDAQEVNQRDPFVTHVASDRAELFRSLILRRGGTVPPRHAVSTNLLQVGQEIREVREVRPGFPVVLSPWNRPKDNRGNRLPIKRVHDDSITLLVSAGTELCFAESLDLNLLNHLGCLLVHVRELALQSGDLDHLLQVLVRHHGVLKFRALEIRIRRPLSLRLVVVDTWEGSKM